jgi:hypothetical protein
MVGTVDGIGKPAGVGGISGRMRGLLGGAGRQQQHQLYPVQQREHHGEPGGDQRQQLDDYRNAGELVYWDGGADLHGYDNAGQRDQSGDLRSFSDFGFDQQHDGGNVDADGDNDILDDHRGVRNPGDGNLGQRCGEHERLR